MNIPTRRRGRPPKYTDDQKQRLLELAVIHPDWTAAMLGDATEVSVGTAQNWLREAARQSETPTQPVEPKPFYPEVTP